MFNAFTYAFKIWLTAILLAPLVLVLKDNERHLASGIYFRAMADSYGWITVIGTILSLPCLLVLWIITYRLSLMRIEPLRFKALTAIACIALSLLLFIVSIYSFDGVMLTFPQLIIMASYILPLIVGCFVYKVNLQLQQKKELANDSSLISTTE